MSDKVTSASTSYSLSCVTTVLRISPCSTASDRVLGSTEPGGERTRYAAPRLDLTMPTLPCWGRSRVPYFEFYLSQAALDRPFRTSRPRTQPLGAGQVRLELTERHTVLLRPIQIAHKWRGMDAKRRSPSEHTTDVDIDLITHDLQDSR